MITGKQILSIAGLDSESEFQIFFQLSPKEYEPVQMDERIDLGQPGREVFRVKPVKDLIILVDGEPLKVPECIMTPEEILGVAGYKSEEYYLKQIVGKVEITYKNSEDAKSDLRIKNKMRFTTCKKAGTPVS